jgi:uncharacterized protein YhaN
MFITDFFIDGFGIYHHQGVEALPPGLVVFVGDNESGKTTLLEFIRTVLFGFRRRGNRQDYPPLRGGNHGGRLVLLMSDGRRVMVERLGRQVTITADGGPPQKEEPGPRLLGINRSIFEHIFAIGLTELQGLELLTWEEVRAQLFSASAGLGAASLPAAMKSLDEELGTLWAPKSKKRIAQLTDRLREVSSEIKRLQGQGAAYAAAQQRKEELEALIQRQRAEMEEIRLRLRRLEQLQQAREPWAVKVTTGTRAKALEAVKDFPPYGLERLKHYNQDLEQIRQNLMALEGEVTNLRSKIEQVVPDEDILKQRGKIEVLLGERERIHASLTELPSLEQSLSGAQEEYKRRLQDLGPDWDASRLAQVDTSVAVRQQVQEFGQKLELAERRLEEARIREEFCGREVEKARRKVEETQGALAALPEPAVRNFEELRKRQEILGRLRCLIHGRELLALKLQDRRQRLEEAEARLKSLRLELETGFEPIPWWSVVAVTLSGFLLDVFLSAYGYPGAGNLTLLAALGAGGLIYLGRRYLKAQEDVRRLRLVAEAEAEENRLRALEEEIQAVTCQLAAQEQELASRSRELAPEPILDLARLEHLAVELEKAREELQARRSLEGESLNAERQLKNSLEALKKAGQETWQAASGLREIQAEWCRWLAVHGLPETVRPTVFEAFLQAVERAREAEAKVAELRQRLAETENYVKGAGKRIQDLLAACGKSPLHVPPGVEDLDRLRRALAEALESEREKWELKQRLDATRKQLNHWQVRFEEKQREIQSLLDMAGAGEEEDFRRRAALHQEYLDCRRRLEQTEIALLNIAGNPEALEELLRELSQTDSLTLEEEKVRLEGRLQVLQESVSRGDQELGGLTRQLEEMAQDEKLGDLLQEQSVLKEKLQDAIKRWAVLVISRHLLEVAREIYERERQPQVIQEAGRFLELMIGERRRLLSVPGEAGLQVEDPTLRRRDEPRWSAGLADQVYLAVRLGLAREFSRQQEPLPVILDEVLVKFDPRRRRGAARVILEFARHQQVLLFTCHPEFQKIIWELHQKEGFQETPVSFFHITDGKLTPVSPRPQ